MFKKNVYLVMTLFFIVSLAQAIELNPAPSQNLRAGKIGVNLSAFGNSLGLALSGEYFINNRLSVGIGSGADFLVFFIGSDTDLFAKYYLADTPISPYISFNASRFLGKTFVFFDFLDTDFWYYGVRLGTEWQSAVNSVTAVEVGANMYDPLGQPCFSFWFGASLGYRF